MRGVRASEHLGGAATQGTPETADSRNEVTRFEVRKGKAIFRPWKEYTALAWQGNMAMGAVDMGERFARSVHVRLGRAAA